jgi:hypothetical protein
MLVMKTGPNLTTKVYRKPTHTDRYLHFKSSHPCHVKRGAVHRLFSRVKSICQDQKNFKKIMNIRHDLMPNEYPQEFVNSIMKPMRSNGRSSDIIYRGTVVIPHVKSISAKFICNGNRFHVRTILN